MLVSAGRLVARIVNVGYSANGRLHIGPATLGDFSWEDRLTFKHEWLLEALIWHTYEMLIVS